MFYKLINKLANKRNLLRIYNYLAFYLCWCLLIFYGVKNNLGVYISILYLLSHFILVYKFYNKLYLYIELITILIVSLIGVFIDNIFVYFKIYNFYSNSYFLPMWYLILWPLFASTFYHSFYYFLKLKTIILSIIAAVSMPFIYYGMAKVSPDFYMLGNSYINFFIISLYWAVLLPSIIKLSYYLKFLIIKYRNKKYYKK